MIAGVLSLTGIAFKTARPHLLIDILWRETPNLGEWQRK
jgi:hypothetical protein